jgi:hypothetical protein
LKGIVYKEQYTQQGALKITGFMTATWKSGKANANLAKESAIELPSR